LKPKYRTLGFEEAELKMDQGPSHKPGERWMMHQNTSNSTTAPAATAKDPIVVRIFVQIYIHSRKLKMNQRNGRKRFLKARMMNPW
jgi:hypothetical protein